jgi:predicted double-glycine peptidase
MRNDPSSKPIFFKNWHQNGFVLMDNRQAWVEAKAQN